MITDPTRVEKYTFGNCEYDKRTRELHRGGRRIHQYPTDTKEEKILVHLLENRGNYVPDDKAVELIWSKDGGSEGREPHEFFETYRATVSKLRTRLGSEKHNIHRSKRIGYGFADDDGKINGEPVPLSKPKPAVLGIVPFLSFVKTTDEGNPYGYDRIDVLVFNYDGGGSALAFSDGELDSYAECDISTIMLGNPYTGDRYYEVEPVTK